jgi:hypothetical protein
MTQAVTVDGPWFRNLILRMTSSGIKKTSSYLIGDILRLRHRD